ncbi:MAG: DeoR/GlpR family DNA-binding transcription regulator [Armatimonadota bacterium]
MQKRRSAIMELLFQQPRMTIQQLAAHFGVSEMSIRRDTNALEAQGLLIRAYGGGVVLGPLPLLTMPAAPVTRTPQKMAIGKLAASLVAAGQTVMVDTGTTALEVARHFPTDANITMATTSLSIAQEIARTPLSVMLLGGFVQRDTMSLYGPLTEQMLSILHVDLLFIGCNGADSTDGFYANDLMLFTQVQAMMRNAAQTVVVAESAKFGRRSFVRYARLEEIHCLVTDNGLSAEDRLNLEERGVNVLIAKA